MGDGEGNRRLEILKGHILEEQVIGEAIIFKITVLQSIIEYKETAFDSKEDFQNAVFEERAREREILFVYLLDEINTNSNSTNEIISLMVGWDLFGEKQFLRVSKWKLLGFLLSDHVIWEVNFAMLESTQIVCVDEGRRLFELAELDVPVDECQQRLCM